MKVLLTGGAGYIGTHIAVELCDSKHEVVIVDNLSNSSVKAIRAVEKIAGVKIPFYKVDCRNYKKLKNVFQTEKPDSVVHLASFKSVRESTQEPLKYWDNNINATLNLINVMNEVGCKHFVFSSSATVYGNDAPIPYSESTPAGAGIASPYGETKYTIERILQNLYSADPTWKISILRYFNPVGAHSSGLIGEDPQGTPNNLMPYVSQVAVGKRTHLNIFGNDYDTPDGTCIRDYIHVVDLARGHVAALEHKKKKGFGIYNLGSGKGTSVMELVKDYEKATGKKIPYEIAARRAGDIAEYFANADKANRELNWNTSHSVADACASAHNWQAKNPDGFRKGTV